MPQYQVGVVNNFFLSVSSFIKYLPSFEKGILLRWFLIELNMTHSLVSGKLCFLVRPKQLSSRVITGIAFCRIAFDRVTDEIIT
jgi:hypothetical protein